MSSEICHSKLAAVKKDSNLNAARDLPSSKASISLTKTTPLNYPTLTTTLFPILPLNGISTSSISSLLPFSAPSSAVQPISDYQSTDILNNKMPIAALPVSINSTLSAHCSPTRAPPSTPPHTTTAPPLSSSPRSPPGTPPFLASQHFITSHTGDDFIES